MCGSILMAGPLVHAGWCEKVIVAGGKIDSVEAEWEIMCFISNIFIYSRKRNMDELFKVEIFF